MILSDITILERMGEVTAPYKIGIEPFDINALQGASYDLKLAEIVIDYGIRYREPGTRMWLSSHDCCLASTLEYVRIPHDCVGRVEGKSSIGRQHVVIHCTAGWIDPGFEGNITLEIVNHNNRLGFLLEIGMPIAQLTFIALDRMAERIYKGKYQGDRGAQGAKL